MTRKLVRQMLAAQILSALTVSVCLLIDNIMIGRYLGLRAIAAYGLANPVLLIIGAIGSMLAAGVQVVCSRSLGRGSQEETNVGYSSAIAITAVISLTFLAVVLIFRTPLARAMGAEDDPALLKDTRDYLAGFIIGAPASMGALILVPFMQMAGKSGLLIAAVLGMTVTDIGLDIVNVTVFHGGMFGMGLASSLSYYVAMVVGAFYFLSKRSVFKFSMKRVSWKKTVELFVGGVPAAFNMVSSVILIFCMNRLLLSVGGAVAVAAYTVVMTLGNASNCISTGTGGVALTLSGILFNEEDQTGRRVLLGLLVRRAILLGLVAGVLLIGFAPFLVNLFIPEPGESQRMAIFGVRMFALGLLPCCINNALKSSYQGVGRVRTTEIISLLEGACLPLLAAFVLSRLVGLTGAWFFFFAGEVLTLLGILGYVCLKYRRLTLRTEDVLLLPEGFGVPKEDLLEADIRDIGDVMEISYRAEAFCRAHGGTSGLCWRVALFVEEMGSNIVTHGFDPQQRNHLLIRLQHKDGRWTLRFRDDCGAFDPVHYVPDGSQEDGMGIRIVLSMADEVRYTYSMNLNNLMVVKGDL